MQYLLPYVEALIPEKCSEIFSPNQVLVTPTKIFIENMNYPYVELYHSGRNPGPITGTAFGVEKVLGVTVFQEILRGRNWKETLLDSTKKGLGLVQLVDLITNILQGHFPDGQPQVSQTIFQWTGESATEYEGENAGKFVCSITQTYTAFNQCLNPNV